VAAHLGLAVLVAAGLAGCGGDDDPASPSLEGTTTSETVEAVPERVVAAGDVTGCDSTGDEQTAPLLEELGGTILVLGDAAYPSGTAEEFERCYGPTWGRFRERTRPAPGNHEYGTEGASGYFGYFGSAAGRPGEGWYSFDLGPWHLVALNSNCGAVGGCGPASPQVRWLRDDLAASDARCTLAYWHHPRFSSGAVHGNDDEVDGLWRALDAADADVVLTGHDHEYERFGRLDADGRPGDNGIRSFVVGTGGRSHYAFGPPLPGSEVRNNDTFGVLSLELREGGYDWRFVPVAGAAFEDHGADDCR
jgi:hypothetical protein